MNKKKIILTIVISGIAFGVNYLINLVLGAYVSSRIGTDAYGFVSLASTMASFALIATSALNSYATRYIAYEYHKKNYEKSKQYYNSVFWGDIGIGICLLIVGAGITCFARELFYIPDRLIFDVQILFLLVFINLFINVSGTALQAAAIIKDKVLISSVFKGISYICEAIVLILLFIGSSKHLFYVGIAYVVASLVTLASNVFLTTRYTPELKIEFKSFRIDYVKELIVNGIWNSLNSLGNTLNSGLDQIVTNAMLGAISMGQVSLVKTLVNVFSGLYQMIAQPFQPNFLKNYAENDTKAFVDNLKFSMKISGMLSNIAFAIVVSVGYIYYTLWVPTQDCNLLYRLTIIAVATSIFEGPVYPLYYIYTLTVKNKIPCIITIVGGVLNILGMYLLIKYTKLGVYAIFITTAIIMLTINGISNPIYMSTCLKIPKATFYGVLARHVVSCSVMTILFCFVSKYFVITSWGGFIVSCAVLVFWGIIIHALIMFNKNEWKSLMKKLRGKA